MENCYIYYLDEGRSACKDGKEVIRGGGNHDHAEQWKPRLNDFPKAVVNTMDKHQVEKKKNQKRPTPKVWICDIHNISPTMLGHT